MYTSTWSCVVQLGVKLHCAYATPRHLKDESELRDQRVNELESYLGGEIPIIKGEGPGKDVTWRDERETLLKTLHVS